MTHAEKKRGRRRVVVTGMGAVTPLGHDLATSWAGIIGGRRVAAPISRFDASTFPCRIACEVKEFQLRQDLLRPGEGDFTYFGAGFGIQAAHEALVQAELIGAPGSGLGLDPGRVGVCLGVGMGSPDPDWYHRVFRRGDWDEPTTAWQVRYFPDQLTSIVGRMAGARGGQLTIHTACASSGQSLGEAYEQVAEGELDIAITGGCDSMLHPYYLTGFSLLGALASRNDDPLTASRPFDEERNGFVLGEGACMLVFEEEEHARRRGARIFGEVAGYGVTESAYRITDLHPEGVGPIEAMQMALADAGISPAAIGYVNAHGTSTVLNDRVEALAISRVFGVGSKAPRVSSTKSMTGHMISAAGALEFAACVLAVRDQILPPSINVFSPDPECPVALTPATATPAELAYALSNSVGFGGSNTALIAGRTQP